MYLRKEVSYIGTIVNEGAVLVLQQKKKLLLLIVGLCEYMRQLRIDTFYMGIPRLVASSSRLVST
jgi:hypothetical protein